MQHALYNHAEAEGIMYANGSHNGMKAPGHSKASYLHIVQLNSS